MFPIYKEYVAIAELIRQNDRVNLCPVEETKRGRFRRIMKFQPPSYFIDHNLKVDLVKPLKTLISSTYSTADQPADHSDAISEMQRLRVAATKATDRSLTRQHYKNLIWQSQSTDMCIV